MCGGAEMECDCSTCVSLSWRRWIADYLGTLYGGLGIKKYCCGVNETIMYKKRDDLGSSKSWMCEDRVQARGT